MIALQKILGKKNKRMNEGQRDKELRLELAKQRNPYLEEEFGRVRQKKADPRPQRIPNRPVASQRPVSTEQERLRKLRARELRRKRERQKRLMSVLAVFAVLILALAGIISLFVKKEKPADGVTASGGKDAEQTARFYGEPPVWTTDYLTPNAYSRPGDAIGQVTNIFVHYTANPGTSAAQNRSYFEQLKDTGERSASAHFIIGYEGEIIQCIPFDEIAYAVQTRNYDSISIECCYLSEDGAFTEETYESLVELLAYLLATYDLEPEDILRHYDCGGKKCPLYYVEHEDAWETLKQDVERKLGGV